MKVKLLIYLISIMSVFSCDAKNTIEIRLESNEDPLYANGLDQRLLEIREISSRGSVVHSDKKYSLQIKGESVELIGNKSGKVNNGISLIIVSTLNLGESELIVKIENTEKRFILKVVEDYRDLDQDGFPDSAELENEKDKRAFVGWFIQIVELQFYDQSNRWSKGNRDCSGLARFAYMEALKKHSEKWKSKWGLMFDWSTPDIERFNYPDIPIIKKNIFRVKGGSFTKNDLKDHSFDIFAVSEKLMRYNTHFISKELSLAQKGDLLFFKNKRNYHLMIFLGEPQAEMLISKSVRDTHKSSIDSHGKKQENYLVYHTGPIKNTEGEVRKLPVSTLLKHPNSVWKPIPENPHFLGLFRWNILN